MSCGQAAHGGWCRVTCRHGGRFTAGSQGLRQVRRDHAPLCVGQIGVVSADNAAMLLSSGRRPHGESKVGSRTPSERPMLQSSPLFRRYASRSRWLRCRSPLMALSSRPVKDGSSDPIPDTRTNWPVNAAALAASTTLTRPSYVTARIRLAGLKKPRPPTPPVTSTAKKIARHAPRRAAGSEPGSVTSPARIDRSRKQIARLHRITGDAQDRRSAFRELAGNLQPGSAGAADNAVGSRHAGLTATSARIARSIATRRRLVLWSSAARGECSIPLILFASAPPLELSQRRVSAVVQIHPCFSSRAFAFCGWRTGSVFPRYFNSVRAGRWRPKPRGTFSDQLVDPGQCSRNPIVHPLRFHPLPQSSVFLAPRRA